MKFKAGEISKSMGNTFYSFVIKTENNLYHLSFFPTGAPHLGSIGTFKVDYEDLNNNLLTNIFV